MVSNLRNLFVTISLIGLFVIASISFQATLPLENNITATILDNEIINNTFNRLEGNLTSLQPSTQEQANTYTADIPEEGALSLIIFSIVGTVNTFVGLLNGVYTTLIVLPASFLGLSPTIFSVLASIFIVVSVLLSYRAARFGN